MSVPVQSILVELCQRAKQCAKETLGKIAQRRSDTERSSVVFTRYRDAGWQVE